MVLRLLPGLVRISSPQAAKSTSLLLEIVSLGN